MRHINLALLLLLLSVTPALSQDSKSTEPLVSPPSNSSMQSAGSGNPTNGTNRNSTAEFKTESVNSAAGMSGSNSSFAGNRTSSRRIPAFYQGMNSTTPERGKTTSEHMNSTTPNRITWSPVVSLEGLSALRSQLDVLDVQVKIATQQKKLRELSMAALPALPTPSKRKARNNARNNCIPAMPKVVSIQGVDGRLSATLVSKEGVQTVSKGDKAGPGRVISITPYKVLVHFKGKDIALKFKE